VKVFGDELVLDAVGGFVCGAFELVVPASGVDGDWLRRICAELEDVLRVLSRSNSIRIGRRRRHRFPNLTGVFVAAR